MFTRDFSIHPTQVLLTYAAGFLTQRVCLRWFHLANVGYLSAFTTCTSLSILLRADNVWVHPLIAAVSIGSKFFIRYRNKHIFNPANVGLIFAWSLLPGAWISPGQWGQDLPFAILFLLLGNWVVVRSRRSDISWAFLASYLGFIAVRILWLGQNKGVWFHQFQNGTLLLFSFFMISDPMTTPNHPKARIFFALFVALLAYLWQFQLYWRHPLLWALFLASLTVPMWDVMWPASKYSWKGNS